METIYRKKIAVISDVEITEAIEYGKQRVNDNFDDIYENATTNIYKNLMKFELLINDYKQVKISLEPFDGTDQKNKNIDHKKLKELFLELISRQIFIQIIATDIIRRESPVSLIVDNSKLFTDLNIVTNGLATYDPDEAYEYFINICQTEIDERIYNLLDQICNWDIHSFTLSQKIDKYLGSGLINYVHSAPVKF